MTPVRIFVTLTALLVSPITTLSGQAMDGQRSPRELRLGLQSVSMNGATSFGGSVDASSGSLQGAELLARTDNIGIVLRTQKLALKRGQVTVGNFTSREARLLLGGTQFSVELGILQRDQPRDPARETLTVGRAGIRSQWQIGGSGLAISLNAGVQLANTSKGLEDPSITYRGHDGEALLLYQAPRDLPFFAAIGWRLQTIDDLPETPAEVTSQSGPVIAIGMRIGK